MQGSARSQAFEAVQKILESKHRTRLRLEWPELRESFPEILPEDLGSAQRRLERDIRDLERLLLTLPPTADDIADALQWYFLDSSGEVMGPFSGSQMQVWFKFG